ncbi:hypothetical protein HDV00_004987 [Rhizophlyctis rosea]|nr:hypothetical protein HDV00_004987 [Rhizophlyctis rosea]
MLSPEERLSPQDSVRYTRNSYRDPSPDSRSSRSHQRGRQPSPAPHQQQRQPSPSPRNPSPHPPPLNIQIQQHPNTYPQPHPQNQHPYHPQPPQPYYYQHQPAPLPNYPTLPTTDTFEPAAYPSPPPPHALIPSPYDARQRPPLPPPPSQAMGPNVVYSQRDPHNKEGMIQKWLEGQRRAEEEEEEGKGMREDEWGGGGGREEIGGWDGGREHEDALMVDLGSPVNEFVNAIPAPHPVPPTAFPPHLIPNVQVSLPTPTEEYPSPNYPTPASTTSSPSPSPSPRTPSQRIRYPVPLPPVPVAPAPIPHQQPHYLPPPDPHLRANSLDMPRQQLPPPIQRSVTPDSRNAYSEPTPSAVSVSTARKSVVGGGLAIPVGDGAKRLSVDQTLALYRANAAKTTDPKVQLEFAKFCLEEGERGGVEEGVRSLLKEEGVAFLKKLSKDGLPEAMYLLADHHYTTASYTEAYPLFLLAAKRSHAPSCYMAGQCAEFGRGTKRSNRAAVELYSKAAQCGYGPAMLRLGMAELEGGKLGVKVGRGDVKKGVAWLKRCAAVGDPSSAPQALLTLSHLHAKGLPPIITIDEPHALSLLTESAHLSHAPAQTRLAICHENGLLTLPKNIREAITWYRKAAENGDADAQYALASFLVNGVDDEEGREVLEKSEGEAFWWCQEAAKGKDGKGGEGGLAKAQFAMGYFLENGVGCERNGEIAVKWYRLAARQGDERAVRRLDGEGGGFGGGNGGEGEDKKRKGSFLGLFGGKK